MLEELVFADDPVSVPDQMLQQLEDLRLQWNRLLAAPKLQTLRIEPVWAEAENQRCNLPDAGNQAFLKKKS